MSSMGPEVLPGSNQGPKGFSIPTLYFLQKVIPQDIRVIRPATLSSWLKQLSYFVTNKQTESPWTWSKLKLMISGPSQPLRPFMVGIQWTQSCKLVTGKLTIHLPMFT